MLLAAGAARVMSDTQDADNQINENDTKVQNLLADIMKESLSVWKWILSRISLVKMLLGLT